MRNTATLQRAMLAIATIISMAPAALAGPAEETNAGLDGFSAA